MTTELTDPYRLISDTLLYIEKNGWVSGKFSVGEKKCLLGALIHCAYSDNKYTTQTYLFSLNIICETIGTSSIISWNDSYDRTSLEVRNILRHVLSRDAITIEY